MSVTYVYARFFVRGECRMKSFDQALGQASYDMEYNEACPIKILAADGRVLWDREREADMERLHRMADR